MYQDISSGLSNVWLENGFQRHQTKFGEGVSFSDIDGLEKATAIELCIPPNALSNEAVRFLRTFLQISQAALGEELGCTAQAVAKWEKGETPIPVTTSRLLKLLALKKISPRTTLETAISGYKTEPLEKIVLSYSETHGWHGNERTDTVKFYRASEETLSEISAMLAMKTDSFEGDGCSVFDYVESANDNAYRTTGTFS